MPMRAGVESQSIYFSPAEQACLLRARARHGNQWGLVYSLLPVRTPARTRDRVKQHWNRKNMAQTNQGETYLMMEGLQKRVPRRTSEVTSMHLREAKRATEHDARGGDAKRQRVERQVPATRS